MLLVLEVEESENSLFDVTRSFQTIGDPRPISKVSAFTPDGTEGVYEVVGWSSEGAETAFAAMVDDSGEGAALLVYGGDEGIRLRPQDSADDWSLEDASQWGEVFLLLDRNTFTE